MITVIFDRDENTRIKALYMSGHSGYSEHGTDIVCAGASTLFYTAANALEVVCGFSDTATIHENESTGDVNAGLSIPETNDKEAYDRAQIVMKTVETGFISLASSVNGNGKKYIEIL